MSSPSTMNVRKALEREHSLQQTQTVVDFIGDNPEKFSALVEVFLEGPYRITQRAAWPLSHAVEKHPQLIAPHLKRILKHLRKPGIHNAVKRNTVRLLQFIDIPRSLEGHVAQICFEYLSDRTQPVAVRVFSMTVLSNISESNPDLKRELQILIEDELPYASAAFRSRAKEVLKPYQKLPKSKG